MNFIEANGVSLRYAVQGSGKTLVLIHEMGGTMESWGLRGAAAVGASAASCATTRAARASPRRSAAPLTIDTMTDDLIALLDGLGINGESRARRDRGRRRDRAAHGVSFSRAHCGGDRHEPGDLDPAGQSRRRARARREVRERGPAHASSTRPPRTAIRKNCAATGRASRAFARAGSRTIRRALRRSTACSPTWTSPRSFRRSNARCW